MTMAACGYIYLPAQGFRLVDSARYPRRSTEVPYLTQKVLKDLMKKLGLGELREMPGSGEGSGAFVINDTAGHICIEDLKDNTEYLGIPAPARPKL